MALSVSLSVQCLFHFTFFLIWNDRSWYGYSTSSLRTRALDEEYVSTFFGPHLNSVFSGFSYLLCTCGTTLWILKAYLVFTSYVLDCLCTAPSLVWRFVRTCYQMTGWLVLHKLFYIECLVVEESEFSIPVLNAALQNFWSLLCCFVF